MCHHDHHQPSRADADDHGVSRRTVLGASGALAATALAGCLGGDGGGDAPAAISIGSNDACDNCGMVIANHPGPNGQIFWQDYTPDEHDAPFRFDALKQCLFPHLFDNRDKGRTTAAVYVTDYSAVEYTVSTSEDAPYISSHPEAGSFAPAQDLSYVVGSDVNGAMGADFVPFSDSGDADAFADEYGGDVVSFDDITPALVGR
ncbi:nitrous oxide reductase accessory protein NosL [Haloarchaeobius baliensis]|uniref:nitrous oxide reductase accessory protein NosL n=1 Tax=Haloarchaeobius baliensis TaxID=1670458 RepID=UPI003F881E10